MNKELNITVREFRHVLDLAISTYNLNPGNTFVEITWWNKNIFKPLIYIDRSENGEPLLIFGEGNCAFYKAVRNKSNELFPTGFYINVEATAAENVVCRPYTLRDVFYRSLLNYDDNNMVGFLFSNSPINYYVKINPFKTRVYKNRNGETILALYVDDRDSGEFMPAFNVTGKNIKMFEDI